MKIRSLLLSALAALLLTIIPLATPAHAAVWTLADFFPNLNAATSCATERDSGSSSHDFYVVAEPLSTCGATNGTCWRRSLAPSRAQGSPGVGFGWDYQTVGDDGQGYYFGFIFWGASEIVVLQVDNPELNAFLPATVNDGASNPLWSTIYQSAGTQTHYDNSWVYQSSTFVANYTRIEINRIDDPVFGSPFVALAVESFAGPTSSGPWTANEKMILSQNLVGSDTGNCGGSAHAVKGMYQWTDADGSTVLFKTSDGWQYHP